MVERAGFKKMINTFQPTYKIPKRKAVSDTLIPKMYISAREAARKLLAENLMFFSITTDGWTSTVKDEYCSLTVHFVNKQSWELESLTLECLHVPQSHTAVELLKVLRHMLKNWGLKESKLSAASTDNARNIVRAIEDAKWLRIPCCGHVVNLL